MGAGAGARVGHGAAGGAGGAGAAVVAGDGAGAATGAGAGAMGCSVLEFHRPDDRGTIVVVSASCCLLKSCCTDDLSHAAWKVGSTTKKWTRKNLKGLCISICIVSERSGKA